MTGVTVSIAIFIIAQTIAAVWWAATITAKLSTVTERLSEAVRELKGVASKEAIDVVHKRIDKHDERIRAMENARRGMAR